MKTPEFRMRKRDAELLAEHKKVNAEIDQEVQGKGIFSRGRAAEIFQDLSGDVWSGHMPENVSPYVLGRAVRRTVYNNHLGESYNDSELLRGLFLLDEAQRKEVMELIHKMEAGNQEEITDTRSQLGDSLEQ